jgi:transcription elongation factor GreA
MEITYLSQERFEELSKELHELKTKGRQAVALRLKTAKELGDLSENSEYQEAREEQSRLEHRIFELEELLRRASIIKKSQSSQTVRIGSKVKVKKDGDVLTYTIVGSNEANPAEGLISNESPIGRALLGKKVGDSVSVKAPKGEMTYQILEID